MSSSSEPADFRPERMPAFWCLEVLRNHDDGNFEAAANAQLELTRLGWELRRVGSRRTKPAAPRTADAGREGEK